MNATQAAATPPTAMPSTAVQRAALADTRPTPLLAAVANLAASRQRLRLELLPPHLDAAGSPGQHGPTPPGAGAQTLAGWWRRGRRALQAWPVADLAAGLLQDWWQNHPWRHSGEQLASTARAALVPAVQKHPLGALLAAAALGAALVACRAWRWPAVRALRPVARQGTGHWLAAQLANPAVQTALFSALMLLVKQQQASGAASAARTPPAPDPSNPL